MILNSSNTSDKVSIKNFYLESKNKVRLILNLLGRPDPGKINALPDEKSFVMIQDSIKDIVEIAKIESENSYRDAIVEIATWMSSVFRKDYLIENEKCYPNPVYAVKKGAEILHSFLHRDLRRKQFSFEEEEIFRNYRALMKSLPVPSNK